MFLMAGSWRLDLPANIDADMAYFLREWEVLKRTFFQVCVVGTETNEVFIYSMQEQNQMQFIAKGLFDSHVYQKLL